MWRAAVAGLVAAALAVGVAAAQGQSQGPQPRVLVDLPLRVTPPDASGHCFMLSAGAISVTAQLVGEHEYPVQFEFWAPRGADDPAGMVLALQRVPVNRSANVAGGLYCYAVQNQVPAASPLAGRFDWQDVTLRLLFTPRE